jgi:predicted metal-binding membrane protein
MESARLPRPISPYERARTGLIALLLVLALVAWVVTDERMGGMDAGPGTALGTLSWFVTVWVVMMAAMMFPSIAPMVVMYRRIQEGKRDKGEAQTGATTVFVAGYLVAWTLAGLVGYAIFDLTRSLHIDALSWDRGGPYLAGGVLAAAAIYQLTPLKDACLTKCRSPMMFLMTRWKPGRVGAIRMGIEHGGWCVGCCWGLMAALFALGVMSVGWMVFIAALIAIEKMLPWKILANRGIALLLLALGLSVALFPESVPGLTIPGSPEAQRAMQSMGMDDGGGAMKDQGGAMKDQGGAMKDQGGG